MRILLALLALVLAFPAAAKDWPTEQHVQILKDFRFGSGETLAELRIGYTTLGSPHRNEAGEIDNAVMLLHGTGGSGRSLPGAPQFADALFGPGQPLDIARYYIISPDGLGHGASSKPSDGMRMDFPRYDYDDMVAAQYRLLTEGLGIKHLELILGTSMGCMQAFVWGEAHPGFARRLAPFACLPVAIAGRNRMWRKALIDTIEADPEWQGGNYARNPPTGMRAYAYWLVIAGGNPVALQDEYPTREGAEAYLAKILDARLPGPDANDTIYQFDASRNYDPSAALEKITVPVLWINSADDFINPPELGIAEREVKRMPRARFVLIPASAGTKGHGTHTWAKFWKADLARLMAETP